MTARNEARMCDTCARGGESSVAAFWCNECEEALCETCMIFHQRIKSTSTHGVSKMDDGLNNSGHDAFSSEESDKTSEHDDVITDNGSSMSVNSFTESDVDESCLEHPGQRFSHFCFNHQSICCEVCIRHYHTRCSNISTIDEMTEDFESAKQTSAKFLDVLQELDSGSETILTEENTTKDVNAKYQCALDKMAELLHELKTDLSQWQENIETNLKREENQQAMYDSNFMKKLENISDTLKSYQKSLKSKLDSRDRKHLFILIQNMKTELKTKMDQIISDVSNYSENNFDIKDGVLDKLDSVLQESKCLKFVPLNEGNKLISLTSMCDLQQNQMNRKCKHINVKMSKTVDTIDVHARKISEIRINGSRFHRGIFLNDDRILIPDYNYEKLKIYDVVGNIRFEHPLLRQPWDVACNTSGRIFVSYPNSMCIKKYTFSGTKVTERGRIDTYDLGIHGFDDVLGDHILYASEFSINILRPNGRPLRKVSVRSPMPFITSSLMESKFYFTDGNDIVCQDLEGTELQRFCELDLSCTIALSMDSSDGLYISNYDENADVLHILKLSDTGTLTLIADVKCNAEAPPRGVTFDTKGRRFMVAVHTETTPHKREIRSSELLTMPPQLTEAGVAEIYQIKEKNVETKL